jgi:CxxC motif-containing protein (DUF1111 family)
VPTLLDPARAVAHAWVLVSRPVHAVVLLSALVACSTDSREESGRVVRIDRSDFPLLRATPEELVRFQDGDALFDVTLREADGLGPLYIRASCGACHADDGRGPGLVRKMFVTEGDSAELLPHGNTERPYAAAGAKSPLTPRDGRAVGVSRRFPPAVFARGYMEAVADEEIERLGREAAVRPGPIRGRIHRVRYESEANPRPGYRAPKKGESGLIGRFGLKARIATVDEFSADALQGDMGITSPLRPAEPPNPDGLADDLKQGVDVDLETVNLLADYIRLLELPERPVPSERGVELFRTALCATCHVPALKTRGDYPIRALAGIDAAVYTDFLLHDMGTGLADGVAEADAGPREWRTAPLIGLRFFPAFLHDGRAGTVEEAVLMHRSTGSEASGSVERFLALAKADQRRLLAYVEAL